MATYDYSQVPQPNPVYQQPYNTLPPQPMIDPTNQYSSMSPYPTQQQLPPTHYPTMMMYPPKTDANFLPSVPAPLPMQPISYAMGPSGGILFDLFIRY
jgi:hypothetical protein